MSSSTNLEAPRMIRVVCVDKDPALYTTLAAGFVELGVPLEIRYCANAQAATEYMGRAVVDVVLCGYEVPGVQTPTYLEEVRTHYPSALRFIHTEDSKESIASLSVSFAHQSFSKTTSARDLYKLIQVALSHLGKIREERVTRMLSRLEKLPSRDAMMFDFLELLAGQTPSIEKICSTVSKHPGMVARIIKVANSPIFGQAGRIQSLDDGIGILGLEMIASLFFSMQLLSFEEPPRESKLDVENLWTHCVRVAAISRRLGMKLKVPSGAIKEATTAALLHDVGKVVLAHAMPTEFAAANIRANADQIPLWQAEKPVLGNSHAEVGGCLLKLWGFPSSLADCVSAHHAPHRLGEGASKAVLVVHLADAVSHLIDGKGVHTFVDIAYFNSLGLPTDLNYWAAIGGGH